MLGNEATRRRSSKRIGASKAQNCRDGATYVKLPAWSQHRRWTRETYLIALHHNTLRLCLDLEFMERNIGEIPVCLLYLFSTNQDSKHNLDLTYKESPLAVFPSTGKHFGYVRYLACCLHWPVEFGVYRFNL